MLPGLHSVRCAPTTKVRGVNLRCLGSILHLWQLAIVRPNDRGEERQRRGCVLDVERGTACVALLGAKQTAALRGLVAAPRQLAAGCSLTLTPLAPAPNPTRCSGVHHEPPRPDGGEGGAGGWARKLDRRSGLEQGGRVGWVCVSGCGGQIVLKLVQVCCVWVCWRELGRLASLCGGHSCCLLCFEDLLHSHPPPTLAGQPSGHRPEDHGWPEQHHDRG